MSLDNGTRRHLERLERLRKLGLRRGARDVARPAQPAPTPEPSDLPGDAVETPFGPGWVRTVRHPLAERPDLAALLGVEQEAFAALSRDPALAMLEPASAAFIDTETTGLSLGTGTYTFLIGIGRYELSPPARFLGACPDCQARETRIVDGDFVVRQFFMRNPSEELAQLHLVEKALGDCTGVISFNGRAFDLPLVQSRFILARMPLPLAGAPHLDLLPPARRIWRGRYQSCSLSNLERNVLGVQRTAEDVPGWMIPDIYREYHRTGLATEMLARVFYHNLEDINSMVLLATRMAHLFQAVSLTTELLQLHPLECLGLARCYEALGWAEVGVAAYRAALAGVLNGFERAQAMRDLSSLYRRLGRREEAAALWEEWIGTIPDTDLTPYIELAKHHEWYTEDLVAARGWTAWALRIAHDRPPGFAGDTLLAELQHRLARLERKLAGATTGSQVDD